MFSFFTPYIFHLTLRFLCSFQIVAVILSNTGIALLAYMDGVAQTRTLGGVVLAAAAAAGSATYKVRIRVTRGEFFVKERAGANIVPSHQLRA
jgi:hypothetical protein